ncbi:MAG: twin-arginine translocase subunit TatC [Dehalococcoidia bacterium]|nr:twin-arginine translocase subunit TatC [Dehalococcoidia bacterium]
MTITSSANAPTPPPTPNDGRMTLVEHLQELRARIIRSLIALVVTTALCLWQAPLLFEILKRPVDDILIRSGEMTGGTAIAMLVFTEPTEAFAAYFRVALLGGFILALPVILYQTIRFVAPGLLPHEKRLLFTFLPFATLSFIAGVLFGYFVLIPPAVQVLLGFGVDQNIAAPFIRISSYIDLVTRLLFWIGVVFETPVFMLILARLGVLRYRHVSSVRRYAIVAAWVLGALITPTFDPINQALVAVPLMVLFEVGVQLVRIFGKREVAAPT